MRWMVKVIVKL